MKIAIFDAQKAAATVERMIIDTCARLARAGSLRRERALVSDVEFVAIPRGNALMGRLDRLVIDGEIRKADAGLSGNNWGLKYRSFVHNDVRFDLYTADVNTWGYAHWFWTGPAEANQYLVGRAAKSPFTFVDGAVYYDGYQVCVPSEEVFFRLFGMPLILPKHRSVESYERWLDKPADWLTREALIFADVERQPEQARLF